MEFTDSEKKLFKDLGIRALILFGSQAQETANSASDFDIGVLGRSEKSVYDALYDLLAKKINRLVNIDIVFLDTAPMELQSHLAKNGKVLYQKTPQVFANYREQVMREYADFEPLRKIFQQATLARITP